MEKTRKNIREREDTEANSWQKRVVFQFFIGFSIGLVGVWIMSSNLERKNPETQNLEKKIPTEEI